MIDLAAIAPLIGLLLLASAFAGVLAGLLGVGGGIVLVPVFFFVFSSLGHDGPQLMQVCLATSLATIVVTSVRSVAAHRRRDAVDWAILRGWAPGIALGAVLGVAVASALHTEVLEALFGIVAVVVGLWFAFGRAEWRLGDAMPTGWRRLVVAPSVGTLSVLMGIGGGSFGVPLMTLHGVPMHRAVATAAGFGTLIAVPSVTAFLFVPIADPPPFTLGAVNGPAFAMAVAMTLITAPLGARLAHRLSPALLRRTFAVFILMVAFGMVRQAL